MAKEDAVLDLVESLRAMIADAWGVPIGAEKCIIEREKALALLDQIKNTLPLELVEARKLVSDREKYLSSGREAADNMMKEAEEQAKALLDKQAIMQEARYRSQQMMATAEQRCRELEAKATNYVENALRKTEFTMAEALESVRSTRAAILSITGGTAAEESTTAYASEEEIPTLREVDIVPFMEG